MMRQNLTIEIDEENWKPIVFHTDVIESEVLGVQTDIIELLQPLRPTLAMMTSLRNNAVDDLLYHNRNCQWPDDNPDWGYEDYRPEAFNQARRTIIRSLALLRSLPLTLFTIEKNMLVTLSDPEEWMAGYGLEKGQECLVLGEHVDARGHLYIQPLSKSNAANAPVMGIIRMVHAHCFSVGFEI